MVSANHNLVLRNITRTKSCQGKLEQESLIKPLAAARPWVTTFHNVCGLACILGHSDPNNHDQVSLSKKERSVRKNGAPPRRVPAKGL